jgi:hypothetical protein
VETCMSATELQEEPVPTRTVCENVSGLLVVSDLRARNDPCLHVLPNPTVVKELVVDRLRTCPNQLPRLSSPSLPRVEPSARSHTRLLRPECYVLARTAICDLLRNGVYGDSCIDLRPRDQCQ